MSDINTILPEYYKHKIAVVGKKYFFIRYRDALVDCIRRYGFEAIAYTEIEEALADKPTCIIVINPLLYPVPEDHSIIWIMIQTEQLFHGDQKTEQVFFKSNIKRLKPFIHAYDIILDGNFGNVNGLKGITDTIVKFFPSGWYPALEYLNNPKSNPEYDLLFIGNMPGVDNRRIRLLEYLAEKYKLYPVRNDLWNEKKAEALSSAKICLNIHFDESRYMEKGRLDDYFANKCFVLSEPMYNTDPYIEGEDYVEFYWTNICEKIDYYLSHEEERKRIAENAYRKIHEHTLFDSTRILIDSLILESYNRYRVKKEKENDTFTSRIKTSIKKILRINND